MNDTQKTIECLFCPYMDLCVETIEDPEEYEDGRCKQRDAFRDQVGTRIRMETNGIGLYDVVGGKQNEE